MNLNTLLEKLDLERSKFSHEALSKPRGNDAFEYGRAVGIYAGLCLARDVAVAVQQEENEKRSNI